jgi:hypothetical protein
MRNILHKSGPATLVLLSVQPPATPPTKEELKRVFGFAPLSIYKRPGWFNEEVDNLATIHAGRASVNRVGYDVIRRTTHVVVLPHGPCQKLFATLAFGEIIICGFTVDAKALEQLESLLGAKDAARTINGAMDEITYTLERAKQFAEEVGARDETVDSALNRHLTSIDPDYGAAVTAHCLARERDWLAEYEWRDLRD